MKTFKFLELASVENSVAGPHFLCPLNLKTHLTVPWGPYASKPHHLQGLPPFSAGHLLCPSPSAAPSSHQHRHSRLPRSPRLLLSTCSVLSPSLPELPGPWEGKAGEGTFFQSSHNLTKCPQTWQSQWIHTCSAATHCSHSVDKSSPWANCIWNTCF